MKTKTKLVLVAVTALGVGGAIGYWQGEARSRTAWAEDRPGAITGNTFAAQLSEGFKQVARSVRPSVVSIESVKQLARPAVRAPEELRGMLDDDALQRFFGAPGGQMQQRGVGSGVIISRDGYIVTNNHVVGGASEVQVTFWDGRQAEARIVGVDPKTDVAVIKVEHPGLQPAPLGNSDLVEVGEWSLAIGSPMELQQSVTAGIISAVGRDTVGITDYENFLQTDAAINPGNSGGPLVNLAGEVIGINTAIASKSGGYMGIGFAIPSNMVRMVADSLIQYGQVQRGQLGAVIQDLTEDLAASFQFTSTRGVLVSDVVPRGPADRAGLTAGDIVTHFNGKEVLNMSQLRNMAAATPPGSRAQLRVVREGRSRDVMVEMGQLEEPRETGVEESLGAGRSGGELSQEQLGIIVGELTDELAERLNTPAALRGVVVTSVRSTGVAARLGVRPGDLITQVGGRRINTPAELQEALAAADLSQGVRLRIAQRTPAGYVGRFLLLKN